MRKGHFEARLYLGNRTKLVASNNNKARLVVLLSSSLEKEKLGVSGDIVDTHLNEVLYLFYRSAS